MRLRRWFMLSLASLALVGCVGETIKNQTTESLIPLATNTPAQSAQPETTAQSMHTAKATTVKSGSFASGEHFTQGTVRIVTQNDTAFLELGRGFKTSEMGPDLVVILHRSSDVLGSTKPPSYPLKEGDYVFLAPLQKFSGVQRYAIPTNINLAEYKSAVIWCRKFNATFGAARLN